MFTIPATRFDVKPGPYPPNTIKTFTIDQLLVNTLI
jgi:hypothetical protein